MFMKYVAGIILIGFVAIMFCGFYAVTHTMAHVENPSESLASFHFAIYQDIATAATSADSGTLIAFASFISLVTLGYLSLQNSLLRRQQSSYSSWRLNRTDGYNRAPKLIQWLSLFEHSPSSA